MFSYTHRRFELLKQAFSLSYPQSLGFLSQKSSSSMLRPQQLFWLAMLHDSRQLYNISSRILSQANYFKQPESGGFLEEQGYRLLDSQKQPPDNYYINLTKYYNKLKQHGQIVTREVSAYYFINISSVMLDHFKFCADSSRIQQLFELRCLYVETLVRFIKVYGIDDNVNTFGCILSFYVVLKLFPAELFNLSSKSLIREPLKLIVPHLPCDNLFQMEASLVWLTRFGYEDSNKYLAHRYLSKIQQHIEKYVISEHENKYRNLLAAINCIYLLYRYCLQFPAQTSNNPQMANLISTIISMITLQLQKYTNNEGIFVCRQLIKSVVEQYRQSQIKNMHNYHKVIENLQMNFSDQSKQSEIPSSQSYVKICMIKIVRFSMLLILISENNRQKCKMSQQFLNSNEIQHFLLSNICFGNLCAEIIYCSQIFEVIHLQPLFRNQTIVSLLNKTKLKYNRVLQQFPNIDHPTYLNRYQMSENLLCDLFIHRNREQLAKQYKLESLTSVLHSLLNDNEFIGHLTAPETKNHIKSYLQSADFRIIVNQPQLYPNFCDISLQVRNRAQKNIWICNSFKQNSRFCCYNPESNIRINYENEKQLSSNIDKIIKDLID